MTQRRRSIVATLLGAALGAALLVTGPAVSSTAAPIDTGCGTATASTAGKYPTSICWIDFSGFVGAEARSTAGQPVTMQMGAYTATFTVHQSDVAGGFSSRDVTPQPAQYTLGTGYYGGIPGKPVLYASQGEAAGATTIEIRDVVLSLGGTPVTGYSLVSASAEYPDAQIGAAGEFTNWNADQPLSMIDSSYNGAAPGGCVVPLQGEGSANVWCNPSSTAGGAYGVIVAAKSATRISASMYMNQRGEREGIAIGIQTARVTLDKTVDGRVDPADAFNLSITSPEAGSIGTASTGTTNEATTGSSVVIPNGAFTLGESAASTSPSPLSYYDSAWACTNATVGSATVLPSGDGVSKTVTPAIGDDITCGITNTALEPDLELVKTVSAESATVGDVLTYSFDVTNTGELPVSNLQIDEGEFNGSGTLSDVDCAASTLAVDASTTCTATYTVTSADVTTATLSNTATASALVSGTTATTASAESSAEVTITAPVVVPTTTPSTTPVAPTAAKPSGLASTGAADTLPLIGGGLLLLLGGGASIVGARRRRARQA